MKKIVMILTLTFTLSACRYSNTFNGTYNGAPASMNAYSKNINKYCISLEIASEGATKNLFISAQSVYDPNDLLKPMMFNTKGANCGLNLSEYLVGNRNTTVTNISYVTERVIVTPSYCQFLTFKNYQYKEEISFELKNNSDDQLVGSFQGIGQVSQYIDRDHPVNSGPIFYCGNPNPYPGPYPYPYPRPFPRMSSF